jgi:proline iminopeptidase
VTRILDKYEKTGAYEAPEYEKTMQEKVYTRYLCRLNPWPEPLTRAFRNLNAKVYNYLQGPNEFVVTGTMKNWERWSDLPRIMADSMPDARAWISENGSHMAMYDDQIAYFRKLLTFLKSA